MKIAIDGVALGNLDSATAPRPAVSLDVVDGVVGNVYERRGHVQAEVVACRTGIGNLETVEGDVAASQYDHGVIVAHRVLNLARASGDADDSDVSSRSSRFHKLRRIATVIVRACCDLHGIARGRNIEGMIGCSTGTGLTAGVGIAARWRDIVCVAGASLVNKKSQKSQKHQKQ